ncbi:MAG: 2-succinyl-6-hydroxy-2,4-cyclohexadiene-1-carboxylate synthase [Actinomycetia bacterium]|nr:2-succinyl-6-hydroxy-2,4-cyclohexadiene-1-carboxylate synthase [Actinomycetes bacterium]
MGSDGVTVVLLHGFTGSALTMSGLAEALAASRRVLAIDLVGHGRSDSPSSIDAYGMNACVAQVRSVIDELVAGPADLVGYSMGGRVALSLAATAPQTIRALILVGASAGLADPDEGDARRAADERLAASIETDGLPAFVDRWTALPMWASLEIALGPDGWSASRRQRLDNDPVGLALSLRGMGTGVQPPVHGRLATLDRPTLLMAGGLDGKFTAVAHELAAALPRARLEIIAGAGHAAHAEKQAEVSGVIANFLETVDG